MVSRDGLGRRSNWLARQRIVEVIEQLTNEEDGISDFRAFQERLIKADRLERVVDGGSPRLSSSTTQAAIRLREARVHTLLLAMADRSWEDHWYDEDPKELYYLAVGLRFINDADKLFPQSPPLPPRGAELSAKEESRFPDRRASLSPARSTVA